MKSEKLWSIEDRVVGGLGYHERWNYYALLVQTVPCLSGCPNYGRMIVQCYRGSWIETPGYTRDQFLINILLLDSTSYYTLIFN